MMTATPFAVGHVPGQPAAGAAGTPKSDEGVNRIRWEAWAVTSAQCLDGPLRVKVLAKQFCCGLLWGETSYLIEREIMVVGYFTVYRVLH